MKKAVIATVMWVIGACAGDVLAQEPGLVPFEEDRLEHPPSHPTFVNRRTEIVMQSTASFLVSSWVTYNIGHVVSGLHEGCKEEECKAGHDYFLAWTTVTGSISAMSTVWLSGRANGSTSNCLSSSLLTLALGTTLGLGSSVVYHRAMNCRERGDECFRSLGVRVPMSVIMAASTTAGAVLGYQLTSSWRGGLSAPSDSFYKFSWAMAPRPGGGMLELKGAF